MIPYARELELKLTRAEAERDQWKYVAGILAADLVKHADAEQLAQVYDRAATSTLLAHVWQSAADVLRQAARILRMPWPVAVASQRQERAS